ncbi:hypothetical protein PPERSA_03895 [Pseudocohnilembus persalinus]|uniref:Hsp70-Hsp90 organising protein n=1 Tax=Pseudocohnilembus persalinus TaxID=266149 RepID=A0A0V0Q931_PSEPJ|nr:hypothetical protein PPERSA_03895 [Pseudocohnilembus persalinus]|eukprot:KRW98760.1 hypothetical protein PPERSA_03895 [Pseudocohnilembus persalinus]
MADQATEFKNQGNQAFKEQNYEKAAELFGKAIECNPSDHVLYSNRSGAYASLKNYEKALEDANKCVELKGDWAKGYVRKGLAEFYLQKYDDAISTYNKGLELDPSNVQLKEGKERAETEKITGGKSVPGMDQSQVAGVIAKLKANSKTAAYLNDPKFLQQVQMFLGNPDMMKQNPQMMLQLIQQDPRLMECFMVLQGIDPEAMGKAQPESKTAQGSQPQEEEFQMEEEPKKKEEPKKQEPKKEEPKQELDEADKIKNEGNAFFKQKKYDQALEKYEQAIQKKPTELLYYNNKAACYIEKQELDKAQEEVEKALKIREEEHIYDFKKAAKLYSRLGSIFERKQQFQSAIEYYNKSLLEEANQNVKIDLRRVEKLFKIQQEKEYISPEKAEEANERAKVLFKDGKFKDALEEYNEATKRNPEGAKYFCNRGICFIKLMEWFKAVEDFDKCISLDDKYVKAYIKKADCQSFMKEYHKAKGTLDLALKIEPNNEEAKQKLQQITYKMYSSSGTKEEQEQRAQQAMKDPEIQKILMTPEIQNALKAMQSGNQTEAMKIMQDPHLGPKIQTLIEAGVLRLG